MPDLNIRGTVQVDRLGKKYTAHLFQKKVKALSDVTFQVGKGEVFGIVGPNGAGKSSLLKILLGFIRCSTGTVRVNGLAPTCLSSRSSIGYLPETSCLYANLSIHEHLQFVGRVHGFTNNDIRQRIKCVLRQVDLLHAGQKPVRNYSKGMAQRAALACALLCEPDILILDEPMSGLDPVGRQMMVDLIFDYNRKGNTVLFCSHILTDVERICHRIGILNKGVLEAVIAPDDLPQPPKTMRNKSPLEAFFLEVISRNTEEKH
ncbi:MAG: ABC transporter ATP-binding protein [Desulfocapsa sp.]|nr:ABC transporter ATP-binding protein [Desulfocapsa sp.]